MEYDRRIHLTHILYAGIAHHFRQFFIHPFYFLYDAVFAFFEKSRQDAPADRYRICAEGKRLLSSAIVQGRIAPLSPGEAYALLIEAAEGGDADACLLLGDRHARGDGIDQNCEKARRCYARARDLGRKEEAEERLARLPRPDGAAPWLADRGRDAAGGR